MTADFSHEIAVVDVVVVVIVVVVVVVVVPRLFVGCSRGACFPTDLKASSINGRSLPCLSKIISLSQS